MGSIEEDLSHQNLRQLGEDKKNQNKEYTVRRKSGPLNSVTLLMQ